MIYMQVSENWNSTVKTNKSKYPWNKLFIIFKKCLFLCSTSSYRGGNGFIFLAQCLCKPTKFWRESYSTWLERRSEMKLERRLHHGTMIPHWVSYTLRSNLTTQAFTESPTGLVGLEGSLDFPTSDEHGDLPSHECSADVVLFSFDFVSFKTHTWLRNILSNCSFCALRASSSLSRELFSEFKSSLSYKNDKDSQLCWFISGIT